MRFRLPESTVRAIDLRYLERWSASRRKPALRQMGVDEIYLGKKTKFVTVVDDAVTVARTAPATVRHARVPGVEEPRTPAPRPIFSTS
jgi:hypothetical protein